MPSPGGPAGACTAVSQDAGRETGAPPAARDADVTRVSSSEGGREGRRRLLPSACGTNRDTHKRVFMEVFGSRGIPLPLGGAR